MATQWMRRGTALIGLAVLLASAAPMYAHAQGKASGFGAMRKFPHGRPYGMCQKRL
jgi:hypothetical protein